MLRIILFFIAMLSLSTAFADEPLDKVIAVVNSTTITQSQLNQQMKISREQLRAQNAPIPANLQKQVLDQLINNALQLEVAKKAGITVSDTQLNDAINKIAQQNNITTDQLIKSVAAQGMSETAYREQIKQEMIIHDVQQKMLASQVKLTPQDITDAKGFLKSTPSQQTNPNLQYHVLDTLVSANQTTDMGFRTLSQFPSIFVSAVESLKPGQKSQPIQAPNGEHVLELVAVNGPQTALQPAMTAEQLAFQHKFVEAQQAWLQKLKGQSYVKIME